jgi:hypothetical protein
MLHRLLMAQRVEQALREVSFAVVWELPRGFVDCSDPPL